MTLGHLVAVCHQWKIKFLSILNWFKHHSVTFSRILCQIKENTKLCHVRKHNHGKNWQKICQCAVAMKMVCKLLHFMHKGVSILRIIHFIDGTPFCLSTYLFDTLLHQHYYFTHQAYIYNTISFGIPVSLSLSAVWFSSESNFGTFRSKSNRTLAIFHTQH